MKFHQSNLLKQFSNITSAFTTKKSGNLAFHVGDVADNVVKNHKLLANELGFEHNSLVHMRQIHSKNLVKVNDEHNFQTPPECDALITNKKNTPLMVMVADCAPILFYDPKQKVIAVAHAGRAGAFLNIINETLNAFIEEYNSNANEIFVSVGAMIQVCCYEVGEEIYEESKALGLEYAVEEKEQRFYLNIAKILKNQLLNAGVSEEHLELSNECTCCSKEKYFSYRAESKTGRFAGIISLN
jgi:polyphenol oxidase